MTREYASAEAVALGGFHPLPEGPEQYPIEFIETRGAFKLREDDEAVWVGLTDKADDSVASSIRKFHRKPVTFLRVDRSELSAYLNGRLSGGGEDTGAGSAPGEDGDRLLLDTLANDAPIVNLVNSICSDGIRSGASDIHIEATDGAARVRYRIDGALRTVRAVEAARFPAVSSRVKIMANLNILERRLPQDGRITVTVGEDRVDLRVSIVPVAGGESVVLRVLGHSTAPRDLSAVGFAEDQLATLRALFRVPHGLVLMTGPTGSGKTTTLNAIIREIASDALKIVTIEDPVEFTIPGVNQIQTNERIGLGFDTILRRVLRQDPNVIMVGEIRDSATAELAVRAALTGHLVLSTLHTNDAVSAIPRLRNMGVEPYLLASVLRGAAAQRLVRRTCPACARPRPSEERERRALAAYGHPAATVVGGTGCAECGGTGFRGRIVIAEVFESDPVLEELVLSGAKASELSARVAERGFRSLARDGMAKFAAGLTALRELEREIGAAVETP